MKEKQNVNFDWLTRRTGDPFADVGGIVLRSLMREKGDGFNLLQTIEQVAKIYVNDWSAKLNAFFLNSKITQPAFKGPRKITETLKFFKGLLDEREPFEEGYCRILGEKTKLFQGGRDNHILSGSGTFINFHHGFQGGVMLSKEALIRMFFVPLGCIQLNDKIALLSSNNEELIEYFVAENQHQNTRKIASRISEGIHKAKYKTPSSALFDFALQWIKESKDTETQNNDINLYHFTNFGATPEVNLHNFNASLFKFYARVQFRTLKPDWDKFSHSFFRNKNAKYLYETDTFELTEKKETFSIQFEEYKGWRNSLYDRLIEGKTILRLILNWVSKKDHPLNFEIVKLYQIILKDMNEKTLNIIERIAEYVLNDSSNIKKHLRNLQKPRKAYAFRTALRRLEEDNLAKRNPNPLFSLEEYALELFPDGTYWQEIQDLLLIAIYQKMHEQEIWLNDYEITISKELEEKSN